MGVHINSIVRDLPDTVPFVSQFAIEREKGHPFHLHLGANESQFGISPLALQAIKDFSPNVNTYGDPEGFQRLIDLLVEATVRYLSAQVEAGAEALQLFDSWAGALPERALRRWCLAPAMEIVRRVKQKHPSVPIILFPLLGVGCDEVEQAVALDGSTEREPELVLIEFAGVFAAVAVFGGVGEAVALVEVVERGLDVVGA